MHGKEYPLVLVNVWDAWSAIECEAASHMALATSSHSVASALGYKDGENIPLQSLLTVVESISRATSIPLTVDFEAGFGDTSKAIEDSVALVIDAGAVGVNLEDGLLDHKRILSSADHHCERIAGARAAADGRNVPLFINARFDGILLERRQTETLVDEAIRRCKLYQEAGANGLFVPGLTELPLIQRLSQSIDLPLNIMMVPGCPTVDELASAGARRISLGGAPFEFVRRAFRQAIKDFSADSSAFFSSVRART
nr:isocitrate lyase/phosphoenolpyruvate mutase family protein [Burkholderia anthina]